MLNTFSYSVVCWSWNKSNSDRVGIIPATCANLTINYLKTHFFIKKGKKLTLNACKR